MTLTQFGIIFGTVLLCPLASWIECSAKTCLTKRNFFIMVGVYFISGLPYLVIVMGLMFSQAVREIPYWVFSALAWPMFYLTQKIHHFGWNWFICGKSTNLPALKIFED